MRGISEIESNRVNVRLGKDVHNKHGDDVVVDDDYDTQLTFVLVVFADEATSNKTNDESFKNHTQDIVRTSIKIQQWSALCNRADHYIFILFLLLLLLSFFPRLISAVGDWMFTILLAHGVALVRI